MRDVRRKYMPPARAHFESHAPRQGIWSDAMRIRTTESSQEEYPEADFTSTAKPDRRASFHCKNTPEARLEMISGFPNPALATVRLKRGYSRKMNSTLQRSARAQATFQAPSDHERNRLWGRFGRKRSKTAKPFLNTVWCREVRNPNT